MIHKYALSAVKHTRTKRMAVVCCGILVLTAMSLTVFYFSRNFDTQGDETSHNQSKSLPRALKVTSDLLVFGNVYWGRYINDWSMASDLKYAYPFSRLNEFNRGDYDAWIAGLECPTVEGVSIPSYIEDDTLQFNCSPDYLPEAAKWFTAFTLANNHTDNQGTAGFEETKTQLDKNGIQYFGHYDPDEIDDICEVVSLPAKVIYDDDSVHFGRLPVALCGYHGVFRLPSAESVAVIKKYAEYLPVLAFPHMGAEYKPLADTIKISFYRSLIDAGADAVLGDHPHWIQNSEAYKGRLIVYSMGNFIFDQQYNAEVTRSAAVSVGLEAKSTDVNSLEKWLSLGNTCSVYKDECLQEAKNQSLSKLSVDFTFGIIGTNDDNRIAKPATPAQTESILDRLDWQNTARQLISPYAGR